MVSKFGAGRYAENVLASEQIIHGGAKRLPVRFVAAELPENQRISWYEVAPGDRCTRHVHEGKVECWLIVEGEGEATKGSETVSVSKGDILVTEPGVPHGLANTGVNPLIFVNVASRIGNQAVTTQELPEE